MRKLNFNKETGPKPSQTTLKAASTLARPDTGDHIVVAMAMRPNGVTQSEVMALLGHPHRNKLKSLLETKQVKQHVLPDSARSKRIKLVYKDVKK